MKKSGKKSVLRGFPAFLLLLAFCFLLSSILVWPLWTFATKAPVVYSMLVLCTAAGMLIALIIKKAAEQNARHNLKVLFNLAVIAAGIALICFFLCSYRRIAALAVLAAAIILIFAGNYAFSHAEHKKS